MIKVVLSGPMTGLPNYNFDAFDKAEVDLKKQGLLVFNPAHLGRAALKTYGADVPKDSPVYKKLLAECKRHIEICDSLILLDGWESSSGAKSELEYALSLGKPIELYKQVFAQPTPKQQEFSFSKAEEPDAILEVIDALCRTCNDNAVAHGWWEDERSIGEIIALIHSELSEALEYARKDINTKSNHIPEYSGLEEEFADVLIRIFDYCGKKNLRLGLALLAKMKFNKTRPYKHGKRF